MEKASTNANGSKAPRVGVADYFAILGVGQKLVWKHAQKKNQPEQQQQQRPDSTAENVLPTSEGDDENDAALMERFYREIVEVSIVTVRPKPTITSGATTTSSATGLNTLDSTAVAEHNQNSAQPHHQQQPQQQIITVPSYVSTEHDSAELSLSLPQHQQPYMMGSPVPSDVASSIVGTEYEITSTSDIQQQHFYTTTTSTTTTGNPKNPLQLDGWTVLSQTRKAGWCDKSSTGSRFWQKSQVFDANLDPIHGMLGHFRALEAEFQQQKQLQQNQQPHSAKSGGNAHGGTSHTPLKDLKRRMQSGWPKLMRDAATNRLAIPQPKFYLAYRRRSPDEGHRPAIANLQIYYVKLHKSLVISAASPPSTSDKARFPLPSAAVPPTPTPSSASVTTKAASVVSSGASSFLGAAKLVGRVAKAGKQVVQERVRSQQYPVQPKVETEVEPSSPVAAKIVPLQLYLGTPPGRYEEWSIPHGYQQVKAPPIVSVSADASHPTSPSSPLSHFSRYSRRNSGTSSALPRTFLFPSGDDATVHSGGSGVGVEAVAEPTRPLHEASHEISPPQLLLPSHIPPPHDLEHISVLDDDFYLYIPVVAVRRQRTHDEERYYEDPGLVDVSVTFSDQFGESIFPEESWDDDEEDEEASPGTFSYAGKTPWSVSHRQGEKDKALRHFAQTVDWGQSMSFSSSPQSASSQVGTPSVLIRHNLPSGFCDAAFSSSVLDRFPYKNYKGLPLPKEELPMFCYPTGCRLYRAPFSEAPLAQYYGFCVKNEQGDSIYVSCVSFMEPLTKRKLDQLHRISMRRQRVSLAHRRYWEHHQTMSPTSENSNLIMTGFEEMATFENKTICLVSRYPYWTAFRRFLSHLHIMSGSTSEFPLERCISHLLLSVPIPKPGGPAILIPLPTLNVPMVLSLPPSKDLPLMDLPLERLVSCLDVPTIVTIVLGFLALERKVIVMSTRPSLVLDVCELLRSLLFPFELCAPYVPRLTEPFMTCLDFPGAIFVGIHDDETTDGLAAVVRKCMPEDSMIVDLDQGTVDCQGDSVAVSKNSWGVIPPGPRSVLVSEIETLCRDAGIVPGQEPLDSLVDSAFDAAVPSNMVEYDGSPTKEHAREPLDDRALRDSFLRFFCSALGGYERYLVVPDIDFLVSGNEWFDEKGFLASISEEKAAFLGQFCSTQMFQSFIQRRTEASDVHCLLFDECLAEFHATTIPYGRLGGDVEQVQHPDSDKPQMLYSLLVDQSAAESRQFITNENKSFDAESRPDSDTDSSAPKSMAESSAKGSDFVINASGDWVTIPSKHDIQEGARFMYCQDGNPSFPDHFNANMFYPSEPESWLVEMTRVSKPQLTRTETEVDECERRRKQATSHRGLQTQRRCLWQLPKLMGSHFLGTWLLCTPAQIGQPDLSNEQQSTFLLRALGALRQFRGKQRIVPDEAAYRALMVACSRTQSDRRLELVRLFGYLRSDGIFPSAVTLGQYTKALAEGYNKRSTGNDEEVAGVEVTEFASRDLRIGKGQHDAEIVLSWMDTNLADLEDAGRRWRQKTGSEKDAAITTASSNDRQRKRSSNKPWLPVVFSSSIVPSKENEQGSPISNENCGLIAIWSRCKACDSCGYIPLEEEVQAGWDMYGGESDIPGAISCPRCGHLFVPMLGYKELTLNEALAVENEGAAAAPPASSKTAEAADFYDLPPQIGPMLATSDASYVAYISPSYMRLSLEQHIAEHGEEVLDRERMKQLDPELFYNFWWYCARFSLPLPFHISTSGDTKPKHYCALAAWDSAVAKRGCQSCARALSPFMASTDESIERDGAGVRTDAIETVESFDEYPLLSRFNLQGFYSNVWDHEDMSEILVALVEACDKRDFRTVLECLLNSNARRRQKYGNPSAATADNDIDGSFNHSNNASQGNGGRTNYELDCYRTMLYLAKYQCASAFHAFFPATLKPCKGYHFWCPIAPLPIFDRLLREAVKRQRMRDNNSTTYTSIHDVSDVALGFRCVFGHLI